MLKLFVLPNAEYQRKPTIGEHQEHIRAFLKMNQPDDTWEWFSLHEILLKNIDEAVKQGVL